VAIGAFGLIHAGTVRFLRAARAECDRLFVVVVAEAGAEKSLLTADERHRVLSALREIDGVAVVAQPSYGILAEAAPDAAWFGFGAEEDLPRGLVATFQSAGIQMKFLNMGETCTTRSVLQRMRG